MILSDHGPGSEQLLLRLRDMLYPDVFGVFTAEAQSSIEISLPSDHLFLTGSPNVVKAIMATTAKHPTSVTLKLGVEKAAIILCDGYLKSTARSKYSLLVL